MTTNPLGRMDIPVLFINGVRDDLTALVTDKYRQNLFIKWFVNTADAIWIDRTRADFSAFQAAFQALRKDMVLGISPEGTRSKTQALQEGKPGAILLATKLDIPIVPVGISGTETAWQKFKKLRKPHIIAQYGPAYRLPQLDKSRREAHFKELTDEVMCRIAACLPRQYRGVYENHPRTLQLIAEQNLVS